MRPRELPPLPQRGQRTLPTMPSEDSAGDAPKRKKKKMRKQATVDDTDDVEMDGVSSRRASDTGGRLSTDPLPDTAPQKRRRKKKAATIDLEDDQADLVTAEAVEQITDGEEVAKKPKKKKKSRPAEVPLPDELNVEEDDITTDGPPAPPHSLFSPPQAQSQPVAKVFVERNKRFQASERAGGSRNSGQLEHMDMDLQPMSEWSTRDVSLRLHQGFRMVGLFSQGFLAGFAVWHIVVVYVLAGPHLTTLSNLLQQYHGLAYPCQSLLYLLLALSTVGAFDRVNLSNGPVALRQLMALEPVALASFLYFCALILSLSQQMVSDRINLYPTYNNSLWPMGSEQQTLHPWVTVNLVVALLVGMAWVFISTRPDTDYTEECLMCMRIEPPGEEKSEMTA
uniref:Transmembrane protein 237B n=1 Tax=Neogobius melanostomus TaxID=47308 RepID=A0A8C6S504_9GOBI